MRRYREPNFLSNWVPFLYPDFKFNLKTYQAAVDIIEASDLDYTIIRPER